MTLSDAERAEVLAFLDYVEDSTASDDRYGPPTRYEAPDGSVIATRYELGSSAWLEVRVCPAVPEVQVGFATDDPAVLKETKQAIEAVHQSLEAGLLTTLSDAGLDPDEYTLERDADAESRRLYTLISLDEIADLDVGFLDIRDKTIRLLEAYLILCGSTIVPEDEEEFKDEEDEDGGL